MNPPRSPGREGCFLPDFCGIRAVFLVVLVAQALAFVLTFAGGLGADFWVRLGLISLYVQWIALCSAGALCVARRWLARLPLPLAAGAAFLLLLGVTLALSAAALAITGIGGLATGRAWPEFLARNLVIAAIVAAVLLRYLYVQHQWRRQVEAEAAARFDALQARIRPHFLFNSLNTVAALIRSRPAAAEEAVEDLADLFRASLGDGRAGHTLGEEIELGRRYLSIEALRLGDRLRVEWSLDGIPLAQPLPPLTLQPLLENAVYHGIEPLADGGTVRVEGGVVDGNTRLTIENPVDPRATRRPGNRLALDNVRARLESAFGEGARVGVEEGDGRYRVTLTLPPEVAGR